MANLGADRLSDLHEPPMRSSDVNRPRSGKRVSPRIEVIIPAETLAKIDELRQGTRTQWVLRAIRRELERAELRAHDHATSPP